MAAVGGPYGDGVDVYAGIALGCVGIDELHTRGLDQRRDESTLTGCLYLFFERGGIEDIEAGNEVEHSRGWAAHTGRKGHS